MSSMANQKVSSVPMVSLHTLTGPVELLVQTITPIPLIHGDINVLGFRFGSGAYLTDFSSVPESSFPLLQGLDELIVDALRDTPHPMHQTVEQALGLIDRLKPRRAWFTHIAHELPHAETNGRLLTLGYPHVELSYDGLELEVDVEDASGISCGRRPNIRASHSASSVFLHRARGTRTMLRSSAAVSRNRQF